MISSPDISSSKFQWPHVRLEFEQLKKPHCEKKTKEWEAVWHGRARLDTYLHVGGDWCPQLTERETDSPIRAEHCREARTYSRLGLSTVSIIERGYCHTQTAHLNSTRIFVSTMEPDIFSLASDCRQSFDTLGKELVVHPTVLMPRESVENEGGRFRVWCGNLGALQQSFASLDYRLRESPVILSSVGGLLQQLRSNLAESKRVALLRYSEPSSCWHRCICCV